MPFFSIFHCIVSCSLLFLLTCSESSKSSLEEFVKHSRGSLLATSTWPLDHADTARSKMSVNSGLRRDVVSDNLDVIINDQLTGVVFLYTAGKENEWIYSMRGDGDTGFFVNKLRSDTLDIVEEFPLNGGLYMVKLASFLKPKFIRLYSAMHFSKRYLTYTGWNANACQWTHLLHSLKSID